MQTGLLVLAAITLIAWALFALDLLLGQKHIRVLETVPVPRGAERGALPSVSVVIAARNEERNVREGLESVLGLDYPDLDVIVVDDRSEDATGAILDELASGDDRLRVVHIGELPEGWLGKNHASQRGAESARGEVLLFTDADVVFEPTVLARAVRCMQRDGLDHLTAPPDVATPSLAMELFVATFALCFNGYFRPWRMADPKSRRAIGSGAFNLVTKDAWERAGTHAAIALRPDDDLRLGQLLKDSGARQAFGVAGKMVRVEWYPSVREAMRGLEKNTLAAVDFSLGILVAGATAQIVLTAWPYAAVFVTSGPTRWLNAATVVLLISVQAWLLRSTSLRAWVGFALPLGTLMVVFTYLRAAVLTYVRGGIRWRGTFYSLDKLKQYEPRAGGRAK